MGESINLFNLLESQEQLESKVGELAPELAALMQVFVQDMRELQDRASEMLELMASEVRMVTESVLKVSQGWSKESVTHAIGRLELEASVHFLKLNKFYWLLAQVGALLVHDLLRVPDGYVEFGKVVTGTSVIKCAIKEAKKFIEIDLPELKKELI